MNLGVGLVGGQKFRDFFTVLGEIHFEKGSGFANTRIKSLFLGLLPAFLLGSGAHLFLYLERLCI